MPQWEAVSKEIASLRHGLDREIDHWLVSLNTKVPGLMLRGHDKRVPLPLGLPLYPLLKRFASRPGINHLFASAGERLLTPLLARRNAVLTVAKDTISLAGYERNARWFTHFRAIVVQGERDRELMRQVGVSERAIRMIRPGVTIAPYREATGPFTLLFASSPLTAEHFVSRGIYLMLRVAARMPEVEFLLVWRTRHLAKLQGIIAEHGIRNVTTMDGVVSDMGAVYDRVHATVLPAMEHQSFIPCPRSGLDSLAHGKPLLVSDFVGLAAGLTKWGAGVAFNPDGESLELAISRLRDGYAQYQGKAHGYMERYFSPAKHLALHRQLYHTLGADVIPAASPVAAMSTASAFQ
jgi:glycosyltransferase involved in cell wall biosynthesis